MISIKKKDWIEVVLHIAFWIGVFYTLLSLTESHVMIRIDHDVATMKKDVVIQKGRKAYLIASFIPHFWFSCLIILWQYFLII